MNLFLFSLNFTATIFALLWVKLWKCCYPGSADVINELAKNEIQTIERLSPTVRLLGLCLRLPSIARSQQIAESTLATQTRGSKQFVEAGWKGSVRELLIWSVVIGWGVMATSIVLSIAQTGNFLFEYGPESGRPEIVTPYFKVVALALGAQITVIGSGLSILRIKS